MGLSPLAGMPAPKSVLVDVARLEREYHERKPDVGDPTQLVSFGTSGHRGSSGTENIYKIYAESFRGAAHLDALVSEAQELVDSAIGSRT